MHVPLMNPKPAKASQLNVVVPTFGVIDSRVANSRRLVGLLGDHLLLSYKTLKVYNLLFFFHKFF